jgi:hypothetical protein
MQGSFVLKLEAEEDAIAKMGDLQLPSELKGKWILTKYDRESQCKDRTRPLVGALLPACGVGYPDEQDKRLTLRKVTKARYDLFISYSHRADRELARSLEKTLWTFGKTWYQLRGIRTYRDETNLAAEPDLWPAIEKAVLDSECLLLLASPESARSTWVPREVEAFVNKRGSRGLCIAQTGGVLPWTDGLSNEEALQRPDSALSALLLKSLATGAAEPFVADLRPYRSIHQRVRSRDPEYLSKLASIAAKALNTEKEKIWGHYHRSQRLRAAFLGMVSLVLLGLLIALTVAFRAQKRATAGEAKQSRLARERSIEAQNNAEVADAQRRTAEDRLYSSHMKLAQLALDAGDVGTAEELLSRYTSARRGFEWYYLWRRLHREERRFQEPAEFAVLSPSRQLMATLNGGKLMDSYKLVIRDLATQRTLRTIHIGGKSFEFSPDGTRAAFLSVRPGPTTQSEFFERLWGHGTSSIVSHLYRS